MNPAELDPSSVLARARAGLSPTDDDRQRVLQAMNATLAAMPAVGAGAHSGTAAHVPRAGFGWASHVVLASVVAVTAGGIGYEVGVRAGREIAPAIASPDTRPTPPAPAVASPPPAAPAGAPPVALPSAPRPRLPRPVTAPPEKVSPAASLEAEVRALRSVERALREHEPGMALALLRELDRTIPDGKLVEEREATAAIARCTLGDVPFGVSPARDFADRHADSVYLERVEQACGSRK
jgi:hypothetical protein